MISWPLINLGLAALAGAVFFYGISIRDWTISVPGAVMATVFGLQWIGIPVLAWMRRALMRKPPCPSCNAELEQVDWVRWSGMEDGRRTGGARSYYRCQSCGGRFKQELTGKVEPVAEGEHWPQEKAQ